ncbi:hypothetical protein HCC75_12940 (plasmid) [Levilactobacillus brevis]|uniref:hypothetical protein n=1 Tax=Levilactobacillus brevis TaxID=1580 RepID=UPI0018685D34|nr:hypothetical protein [Levilactobacillus brevis]QOP54264.1 hypothetical protein HCC75_12940 [Levilactobacillus brevis]
MPIDRLAQLADGHWKVNAVKIQPVKLVIVLVHKKVVGDFYLADNVTLELNTGRITNLGLRDAKNVSGLVGKILNYRTANPATIKKFSDLNDLIVK